MQYIQYNAFVYYISVVNRWWEQIRRVPWPDDIMAFTLAIFPGQTREARLRRHTVARYLILCEILALRGISTRIRKRFPTLEKLVESGLMLEEELKLYRECPSQHACWQLPIQWITGTVIQPSIGSEPGQILPVIAIGLVNLLNTFKANLRELFM